VPGRSPGAAGRRIPLLSSCSRASAPSLTTMSAVMLNVSSLLPSSRACQKRAETRSITTRRERTYTSEPDSRRRNNTAKSSLAHHPTKPPIRVSGPDGELASTARRTPLYPTCEARTASSARKALPHPCRSGQPPPPTRTLVRYPTAPQSGYGRPDRACRAGARAHHGGRMQPSSWC